MELITNHKYELEIKHLVDAFFQNEEIKNKSIKIYSQISSEWVTSKLQINGSLVIEEKGKYKDKNDIKRNMYILLSNHLNKQLKWGILTGIRPLKLFSKYIDSVGIESTRKMLRDKYFISGEKIEKAFNVIITQKKLNIDLKKDNVYIHIPFCKTKCTYCSFGSAMLSKDLVDTYIEALIKEINSFEKDKEILTIYVGGGTPSAIDEKNLEKLMIAVKEKFGEVKEFTFEAGRVDTITKEKLEIIKKYGVNRISINPQTFSEKTLVDINRECSNERFIEVYKLARKHFDNINMDLIIGLEDETLDDFKNTLKYVKDLNPESITVHPLYIKTKAHMNKKDLSKDKIVNDMYNEFEVFYKQNTYNPYYMYRQKNISANLDNVGYSKEGCEALYNIISISENANVYGFGSSAITKLESAKVRIENIKNIKEYISRIDEMIQRKILKK